MENLNTQEVEQQIEELSIPLNFNELIDIELLDSRIVTINGDICEDTLHSVLLHIIKYNKNDREIPVDARKPIYLYINSLGGNMTDGMGIINLITNSKTPVYTVNCGSCQSMGLLIYLSGEKRYALPNTMFLLHDGSIELSNTLCKTKDIIDFQSEQADKRIADYVISRTSISAEEYWNNYRREWYFYPEEGKQLGVVTHIIGQDCELDDIF